MLMELKVFSQMMNDLDYYLANVSSIDPQYLKGENGAALIQYLWTNEIGEGFETVKSIGDDILQFFRQDLHSKSLGIDFSLVPKPKGSTLTGDKIQPIIPN